MSGARPERRGGGFFGRRHGKGLRPIAEEALAQILPQLRLDLAQAPPAELSRLFAASVSAVRLEIGFGGAEHLLHAAGGDPATGFIGAEPFVNGMAKMAVRLQAQPLPNLRLWDEDAVRLLDWLPDASLSAIDLFYPDPWPKKRHWKRRFVSAENVRRFARVLEPGGAFRFASDIPGYVNWTLLHLANSDAFAWQAATADDWRKPFPNWPGTRYEAKALREGRTPAYLGFRRV